MSKKTVRILVSTRNLQNWIKPTRSDNTLDLFLTNKPSTIYRTEVCPGISDHDLVYIDATTKPVKIKTAPREAFLYKKADYDQTWGQLHSNVIDYFAISMIILHYDYINFQM